MAEAQLAVPSGASLPVNSSAPSWATGVKRAARYTPSNTHNFPRGTRILGVPTVSDRIAQMVVKQLIEPDLDPIFLPDSYGYRPRKSALV